MPKEVERELTPKDDAVSAWVKDHQDVMVIEQDAVVQAGYTAIADYVVSQPYGDPHKRGFLRRADGWLIAHAKATDGVVVTREARTGPGSQQVKIPNICDAFDVSVIHPNELLRRFNVTFVRS